jgi:uncharacterized membrane protein YbjE (DUF340 family)
VNTTTVIIVLCAVAGLALGFLCRRQRRLLALADRTNIPILFLLLFLFGYELGANRSVMSNLATIGGQAVIIIVPAIAGSLALVVIVSRLFLRGRP